MTSLGGGGAILNTGTELQAVAMVLPGDTHRRMEAKTAK